MVIGNVSVFAVVHYSKGTAIAVSGRGKEVSVRSQEVQEPRGQVVGRIVYRT